MEVDDRKWDVDNLSLVEVGIEDGTTVIATEAEMPRLEARLAELEGRVEAAEEAAVRAMEVALEARAAAEAAAADARVAAAATAAATWRNWWEEVDLEAEVRGCRSRQSP